MLILDVLSDITDFLEPVITFFKNIWNAFQNFFLQYMSQDVLTILIFGIVVAIILIVVLAIMNRN